MTLRVLEVHGGQGSTLRLVTVEGVLGLATGSLRVLEVHGGQTTTLRVTKVSGAVSQATTPALAALSNQTVDPVAPITVKAQVTNGAPISAYTWTITGASYTLSADGSTATIVPPGDVNGKTFTVSVTASNGGLISAPVSATYTVRAVGIFWMDTTGALRPMSVFYTAS